MLCLESGLEKLRLVLRTSTLAVSSGPMQGRVVLSSWWMSLVREQKTNIHFPLWWKRFCMSTKSGGDISHQKSLLRISSRCRECDSRRGFGLGIGFIDHFSTQLVITLNYSAIADLYTLKITRARSKCFAACSVCASSCLVTACNNGYSSASVLKSSLNGGSFPTELFFKSKSKLHCDWRSVSQ
jgi:hypothetical protein